MATVDFDSHPENDIVKRFIPNVVNRKITGVRASFEVLMAVFSAKTGHTREMIII